MASTFDFSIKDKVTTTTTTHNTNDSNDRNNSNQVHVRQAMRVPFSSLSDVTDADLTPGTVLAGKKISGKLTLVYRPPPPETASTSTSAAAAMAATASVRRTTTTEPAPPAHQLKFRIKTRLPSARSDYMPADAPAPLLPFAVEISLATSADVRGGSLERLMKVTAPAALTVDVSGLSVVKRGMDGRKAVVGLEGERDVRVLIGDVEYVLFETRKARAKAQTAQADGWDFHADLAVAAQPGPSRIQARAAFPYQDQHQAQQQQQVASTSSTSTSHSTVSVAVPTSRFSGIDPGLLRRSSSASSLRAHAGSSLSTNANTNATTATATRAYRPISALPRLNFSASAHPPAPRRSGPCAPAADPVPVPSVAPAPVVPQAAQIVGPPQPPAPEPAQPATTRIDLRTTITPAGYNSQPRQSLPTTSDGVSTAVSSSADVEISEIVDEFTPSPAVFSVPSSALPTATSGKLGAAAENGNQYENEKNENDEHDEEDYGGSTSRTHAERDPGIPRDHGLYSSPGWTAPPIAPRQPRPSHYGHRSPSPSPSRVPERDNFRPPPCSASPTADLDADGDINMSADPSRIYPHSNGHNNVADADMAYPSALVSDDEDDAEAERELQREMEAMQRKYEEEKRRIMEKMERRRTTHLGRASVTPAPNGMGTPSALRESEPRRHSMGPAAVAGTKRRPETPVHAHAESSKRPNLATPFSERDDNSRAEHARQVDSVRKAEQSRDARFVQGLKVVQPHSGGKMLPAHRQATQTPTQEPQHPQAESARMPPPIVSPAPAPARGQQTMSRMELQRAAEAKRRAEAERQARERAIQQREAQEAERFEAEQVVEAMTLPFTVGIHTYTPLKQISNQAVVNVMGVIVDSGVTKGGPPKDYIRNVVITDPSLLGDGDNSSSREDTVITVFRKNVADLRGFEAGCPILIRQAKISFFNHKLKGQLFSNSPNEWVTLRGNEVLRGPAIGGGPVTVAPAEYDRLKALKEWFDKGEGGDVTIVDRSIEHVSRKMRTLNEAYDRGFLDATVKVLFVQVNTLRSPAYELYVTDGTVSPHMTRNFHNIQVKDLPPSAIFCLSLFEPLIPDQEPAVGDYYFFENLRCKDFRGGGLELNWSNKVTGDQKMDGWRDRNARKLGPEDPRRKETEERIKELQAAVAAGTVLPVAPIFEPPQQPSVPPPPAPVSKVSNVVFTRFTDSINHPITPLVDALADPTVPNKYRIQARVTRLEGVPAKHGDAELAVTFCKKCGIDFVHDHCQSCNDTTYAHAEARWRMLVFLEIDAAEKRGALERFARDRGEELQLEVAYPTEVAVLLADAEAAFLPQLPALHTGPNEIKRARQQIKTTLRAKVEDMLLGNKWEGQRTRPLIDWSIMKYRVDVRPPGAGGGGDGRKGRESSRGAGESGGVLLWKVFGMTSKR